MNDIKLSIVTPVFNAEKTIAANIMSVASQTYQNIEHVIINNCSTDATLSVIEELIAKEDFRHITVFTEKDHGIYDAMNKGIEKSSGHFLLFLGSDDYFCNENVLRSIFSNSKNFKYDFIYGNSIFLPGNYKYGGRFNKLRLFTKNISHQSIFYKKELFTKIGFFDTKYTSLADWNFNMKCFNHRRIKIKFVDLSISYYNENGFSSRNNDMHFLLDKDVNDKKYFGFYIPIMYKNRNNIFIRILKYFLYNPLSKIFNI